MSNKYIILDGNNLGHIAFHKAKSIIINNKYIELKKLDEDIAKKDVKFTTKDLETVAPLMYHLFFMKLHKYYKMFKDCYFIMTWDSPGSADWRKALMPSYKASRDYNSDPSWKILFNGIDSLREILQHYPISQEKVPNVEADDIMYVFARDVIKQGHKAIIISGDSDLIQAAQDFGAKLYNPRSNKYVKPPTDFDYCVYKAIKGDTSDEISGLPKYGEKNATRVAKDLWGEDFIDELSVPEFNKEQADIVLLNLKMIRISNNPNLKDIKIDFDKIHQDSTINLKAIKKFYFDNKMKQMLESFDSVISVFT